MARKNNRHQHSQKSKRERSTPGERALTTAVHELLAQRKDPPRIYTLAPDQVQISGRTERKRA